MRVQQNRHAFAVNFHFLTECNMHCKYCFVPSMKQLSLDDDFLVIEKLSPYFSRINFVGGEPTVSSKLIPLWDNCTGMKSSSLVNISFAEALKSIIIDYKKYEHRYA